MLLASTALNACCAAPVAFGEDVGVELVGTPVNAAVLVVDVVEETLELVGIGVEAAVQLPEIFAK